MGRPLFCFWVSFGASMTQNPTRRREPRHGCTRDTADTDTRDSGQTDSGQCARVLSSFVQSRVVSGEAETSTSTRYPVHTEITETVNKAIRTVNKRGVETSDATRPGQ